MAQNEQNSPAPEFSQQELDQMLAPIALYPDTLLSQVLIASTYPLEVVQAARWSRAHPELKGDDAVKAAQGNDWDPSVIALTAFPQVLAQMDDKLEWTERLGDAFLAQQAQVSDTVQKLRQKATIAGNLQSNDQIRVEPQGQTIVIEEAAPEVVYVPYYNPTVVYGPWWWDAYPPVYWDPWPGYYHPTFGSAFYWGSGVSIGSGFFYSNFDWRRRHVNIINGRNFHDDDDHWRGDHDWHQRDRSSNFARDPGSGHEWRHDPSHRRGVPYREPAVQQQFGQNLNNSRVTPIQNRDSLGRRTGLVEGVIGQPSAPSPSDLGSRARSVQHNQAQPQVNNQLLITPAPGNNAIKIEQRGRPANDVRQLNSAPAALPPLRDARQGTADDQSLLDRANNSHRPNRLNDGRVETRNPGPLSTPAPPTALPPAAARPVISPLPVAPSPIVRTPDVGRNVAPLPHQAAPPQRSNNAGARVFGNNNGQPGVRDGGPDANQNFGQGNRGGDNSNFGQGNRGGQKNNGARPPGVMRDETNR